MASGRVGTTIRTIPYVPILSRTPASSTDPTVGAAVWASGSQVCNGHIGRLDREPAEDQQRGEQLRTTGHLRTEAGGQGHHVSRAGVDDHDQEPRQHDDRAEHRVEDERVRRPATLTAPPERDQEPHRREHDLEEDEEEDEVQRHEGAEHAHLQQQQQADEAAGATGLGDAPHGVHRGRPAEQGGEHHEGERDAVDAETQVDSELGDPARFDDVLLLSRTCGVEAGQRHHRQHQTDGLQRQAEPGRPALGPVTGDQQHQGSRQLGRRAPSGRIQVTWPPPPASRRPRPAWPPRRRRHSAARRPAAPVARLARLR